MNDLLTTGIRVAGDDACTGYTQSLDNEFLTDPGVREIYNSTLAFYQGLWQTVFSGGDFLLEATNFYNAYQLYDYARYQYNHDADLSKVISATDLATLQTLAATFAKEQNGQGPSVRAVAGQTLAAKVVAQLAETISQDGEQDKLTLMFGSYQSFFSFSRSPAWPTARRRPSSSSCRATAPPWSSS